MLSSWKDTVLTSEGHFHGHKLKATMVSVVSRQLDSVLVEQNHCQGLRTVKSNYTKNQH